MLKEFEFWLVPFDWRVGGVGLQRSYDNDSGNLDIFYFSPKSEHPRNF